MKNRIIILITAIMLFSVIGPVFTGQVEADQLSELQNNTNLTDKELLEFNVEDVIDDKELINDINDVNLDLTEQEVKELEEKILNLDSNELLLDEESLAYRDTINPDIDVQALIRDEEEINTESFENESAEVEGQIGAVVVRGLISAVSFLFKKANKPLKATWHLAERMHERGVSPVQVFNAVTKGKKYYDPKYESTVYYYKGVAVAKKGNSLTTTYKSEKPKSRWK
ncbi:DUF4258 domain-containing protein [Peribacillus frigoritolerans]|uniref:DUF4258 domain-containing protein n=1 Tax=Peribacillus frigoritolerans TaxID=450367 RepID=UPI0038079E48